MKYIITYKQGDVVLIPFPFTDFTTIKQRPALIVSSSTFNRSHEDVIVVAITSHVQDKILFDEYLLSSKELEEGGLPKSSVVKFGKIVTIDQRLIRKHLGNLSVGSVKPIIHNMMFKVFS